LLSATDDLPLPTACRKSYRLGKKVATCTNFSQKTALSLKQNSPEGLAEMGGHRRLLALFPIRSVYYVLFRQLFSGTGMTPTVRDSMTVSIHQGFRQINSIVHGRSSDFLS
jgi:hypothetical protein